MNDLRELFRPTLPQLVRRAQEVLHARALTKHGAPPLIVHGVQPDGTPFEESRAAFNERVCRGVQANKSGAPALVVVFPRTREEGS